MRGALRLNQTQTAAIQQLVATAVPQLAPERITVIDDRGTLLHGGGNSEEGVLSAENMSDMRASYEGRLSSKVTEMLERVVGVGKARVEVTAEMDFSQEVLNIQSYNPEEQILVSSREIEDVSNSKEVLPENVSIANNISAAPTDGATTGETESTSRTDSIQNFQTGNTRTERIVPPGRIERLSVAVVVDGIRQADGTYESRTDEEMDVLRELVESAVGLDRSRGDQFSLHNLQFEEVPVFESFEDDNIIFGIPFSDLRSVGQTTIIGLVVLLIALLIVRPLITRIFDMQQEAVVRQQAEQAALLADQSATSGEAGAPGTVIGPDGTVVQKEGDKGFEAMIDIAHIEGRVKASSIKKIGEIVQKHPEEAVSILRNWMYKETS
jgi:flagellar M-ring protein FliF